MTGSGSGERPFVSIQNDSFVSGMGTRGPEAYVRCGHDNGQNNNLCIMPEIYSHNAQKIKIKIVKFVNTFGQVYAIIMTYPQYMI